MGDETWTVVVGRRASKFRALHSGTSSIFPANAVPWHADECDEAPLLLKLERSMTRLEESAFFKKFLDQLQSPAVLNRLCRAASDSDYYDDDYDDDAAAAAAADDKKLRDGKISDEGKILASLSHESRLQITEEVMLECTSVLECVSMFESASVESASMLECASSSLSAAGVLPCESAQNDLESSTSASASPCALKSQPCESAHNDLERSTSASASPCPSKLQPCESANSDLESSISASTSPCVSQLQHYESAHSDSLCDASKGMSRTVRGRNCRNVECESLAKVCCSRYTGEVVCVCRNDAPMPSECCAEAEKELTSINGEEGCKGLIAKQSPGCQISGKHWRLRVVLYGLGSIAHSENSRCQLALILLLKHRFSWVGEIEVFDPVLSKIECKLIESMGCVPIAVDEKGRRSISEPTLFYMPHCEEWLYDHVLQANWVPHTLGQLVILGNSFQNYLEMWSWGTQRRPSPPNYVIQYQQLAREIPLKVSSSDLPGFNDMSWHFYEPRAEGNSTVKVSSAS